MKTRFLFSLIAALSASSANAVDLLTVYEQALAYDSELAGSRAAYRAQLALSDQARATLLPQVGAFGEVALTRQDSELIGNDTFTSTGIGLELTQPLFRASDYFEYRATQDQSDETEAQLSLAQQGLVLDVAIAYFNTLRAQDTLATARAAEAALQRQFEQSQERYDVGLIAITEVLEARAAYDGVRSQRIATESEVDIARETLARLTGSYPEDLEKLEQDFPIAAPEPANPVAWAEVALAQNWEIKAAQFQRLARADQYSAAQAERLPTVDLSASYGRNNVSGAEAESQFNAGQDNAVIALQLNVPLYTGGGLQAGIHQAGALAEQSQAILETTRRNVTLDTRSLYRTIMTNVQSIQALRQTIVSRRSALDATRAGYRAGTRNIVEVLEAEQEYYLALSSYADARYNYVLNSLRLKQAAGILSPQDVRDLNRWLSATAPGIEALAQQVQEEAESVKPSQARP